ARAIQRQVRTATESGRRSGARDPPPAADGDDGADAESAARQSVAGSGVAAAETAYCDRGGGAEGSRSIHDTGAACAIHRAAAAIPAASAGAVATESRGTRPRFQGISARPEKDSLTCFCDEPPM